MNQLLKLTTSFIFFLLLSPTVNGQTIQKSINGQWVNWWYINGNTIQIAKNNQWVTILQVNGESIQSLENGQWVNKYYINGSTVQKAINGQWVNHFYIENYTIKKAINGQWLDYWRINNNTIQQITHSTQVNKYYMPNNIGNIALLSCILESDISTSAPPIAGQPPLPRATSNLPSASPTTPPSGNSPISSTWTKQSRENHYDNCKKNLFARNNKVSINSQEEFCLCYLDKITANHNPSSINNMIPAELKKLQNNYFESCSKQLNIELKTSSNKANGQWTKTEKAKHYTICENDLSSTDKNFTSNQLEDFCLCYIEKLANTYTVDEINDMISPVFKRARQKLYDRCVNSTGSSNSNAQIDHSIYKKSRARGGSFYYRTPPTVQGDGYEISLDNIIAKKDYCKAAIKINNTSSDLIMLNNKDIIYTGSTGSSKASKNKHIVLQPGKKISYVILFEGNYFFNDNCGVTFSDIYVIPKSGDKINAPNYQLPANQNSIQFDDFEVRLRSLTKETKETVANFEVTYHGNNIGLVKPNELGAIYTKNKGRVYANDYKNKAIKVLQKGEKHTFKAIFHIDAREGDMQFENMEILWQDTFQITKKKKAAAKTANLILEKIK